MSLNELTKQISRSQIRFRVVQSCLHYTVRLDNKDKDKDMHAYKKFFTFQVFSINLPCLTAMSFLNK